MISHLNFRDPALYRNCLNSTELTITLRPSPPVESVKKNQNKTKETQPAVLPSQREGGEADVTCLGSLFMPLSLFNNAAFVVAECRYAAGGASVCRGLRGSSPLSCGITGAAARGRSPSVTTRSSGSSALVFPRAQEPLNTPTHKNKRTRAVVRARPSPS